MVSLESDTIRDILGRVDGITLANAGCVSSDFWSIVKEESLWEEACCSLWPSSGEKDMKELISSSLGGFRKFYGNCFLLFANESGRRDSNCRELQTPRPSDFVWVVDVQYMNMPIYSKVVWGIPGVNGFERWFSNCPFRIDLINSDTEDEDHNTAAGLPSISMSGEIREKRLDEDELLGHLMANIRLSWIMINKRTGHVANLSSCSPLVGKRNWPYTKDFVLCFGCILPAYDILPCKAAQCSIGMKCKVWDSDPATLKITEISMHLEDMMGAYLQGRNGLVILDNALRCCKRTKDQNLIVESYEKYMVEQGELREAKMKREGRLEILFTITGVLAYLSFWYFILTGRGVIF